MFSGIDLPSSTLGFPKGRWVSSEAPLMLESAKNIYTQAIEGIKYFFSEYVCNFIGKLLPAREIKAADVPSSPYMSLPVAVDPETFAHKSESTIHSTVADESLSAPISMETDLPENDSFKSLPPQSLLSVGINHEEETDLSEYDSFKSFPSQSLLSVDTHREEETDLSEDDSFKSFPSQSLLSVDTHREEDTDLSEYDSFKSLPPQSLLSVDISREEETDFLDGSDPTQAIKLGSPGLTKAIENFQFKSPYELEICQSEGQKEEPSVPQITITDVPAIEIEMKEQDVPVQESLAPQYSFTPHQASLALSLSLLQSMPSKLRERLHAPQEMSLIEDQVDEVSLRIKAMSETSIQQFGRDVNGGMQNLYKDLFQFGLRISSEDLDTPKEAYTDKAGAQLDQVTKKVPDTQIAWKNLQKAALGVLKAVDVCTDNPLAHSKLKRRKAKLERKHDKAFKWGQNLRRIAGDHKRLIPLIKHTVGQVALHKQKAYKEYKNEKVTPLVDQLDADVKEWLDKSTEWQLFLGAYKSFEIVMAEKVDGFHISEAAVISQMRVWVRGRLEDRAQEEATPEKKRLLHRKRA